MGLRKGIGLWAAILLAGILAVIALAVQTGNPQIAQGDTGLLTPTGTNMPLNPSGSPTQWTIQGPTGGRIAYDADPQGWSVSYAQPTNKISVGIPVSASVANGYEVRFWNASIVPVQPRSAAFEVIASGPPPAAPTTLTAVAASHNRISLTWVDNSSNETGFKVERRLGTGGTWSQVIVAAANTVAFSDNNLSPTTLYFYRVRATNAAGDSAFTNEASATTLTPTPPAAPSALTAQALSSNRIRLTWSDNATDEDGFRIKRYDPVTETWNVVATLGPNVQSYTDSGLSPVTSYTYRVHAFNPAGSSTDTPTASATTLAGPPPSSRGTEFWLALPSSGPESGVAANYYLYIVSDAATSGTVSIPGTSFTQAFSVMAGGSTTITLPAGTELSVEDGVESRAIRVVADLPVGVQVLNYIATASEGFTALPVDAIGRDYLTWSYPAGSTGYPSEFASLITVVATQDATVITLTPSISVGSRTARTPYQITLNQGQAYQLKAGEVAQDLTGTSITANKPVAVFCGNQGAFVPVGVNAANPLLECIPSVDRWGLEFVAVPFATRAGDRLRIIAARNDTQLVINGTPGPTLARGAFHEYSLSSAVTITANKPVLVVQLSHGSNVDGVTSADPFACLIPALSQFGSTAAFHVPEAAKMSPNYVNVVAPSGAVGDLKLDSAVIPTATFTALGSTGYAWARIAVTPGPHTLSTPLTGLGFGAWSYGFGSPSNGMGGYDGYGFPAAVMLPTTPGFIWTPPNAPSNLTALPHSPTEIRLTWIDNSTDERGFRLERKSAGSGWGHVVTLAPNAVSYANTGLTKATAYTYRVRAFHDLDSDWSNESVATTLDTPPDPPTGLTATAVSQTRIDLRWTDASNNETTFKIERKTGTGGTWTQIATLAANTTTFSNTGLTKKTQYFYRVRATNTYGDSAFSAEAQATTKDDPPSAPSGLTAVAPNWNRVDLTWVDNSDNEQGFKVERLVSGGNWEQIALLGANVTSVIDLAVTGATTYSYRVRAYNNGGDSANSNTASVTTPNPPPPTAPSNLVATAISSSQIKLDWTDTSNVETTFTVQRAPGGTTNWTTVTTLGPNTTTWTNGGLTPETTYSYRVNASNVGGASVWAGPVSATTGSVADDISPPPYVLVYATSRTSIRIYWEIVPTATQYRIYRSITSNTQVMTQPVGTVNVLNGQEHFFDDRGLVENQDYYYVVTACRGNVESSKSEEDSHFPNGSAIPWDSSSSAIVGAAIASSMSDPDLPFSVPYGNTDVMGPNGMVYAQEIGTVSPTDAIVDEVNWRMIIAGNELPLGTFEWAKPAASDGPSPTRKEAGPFRRVVSNSGYSGVSGFVTIPQWGPDNLQIQESNPDYTESAYTYVGASGAGFEVDAGLTYEKARTTPVLPRRWTPIIRIQDGKNRGIGRPVPVQLSGRALVKQEGRAYIDASSLIGNDVCLAFFVDPKTRLCRLYVFAVDHRGLYVARRMCAAGKIPSQSGLPVANLRMKRVTAIGQNAPPSMLTPFSNAFTGNDLNIWRGSSTGWVNNSSVFRGSYFKRARLYNGSTPLVWTPNRIEIGRGNNYKAEPPVTASGDATTGGAEEGGLGERCDIIN